MPAAGWQNTPALYYLWRPVGGQKQAGDMIFWPSPARKQNPCFNLTHMQKWVNQKNHRQKEKDICTEIKWDEVFAYWWSVVHHKGTQSPGKTQTQQDVKDIAAYRVRHRHVPHAWKETDNVTGNDELKHLHHRQKTSKKIEVFFTLSSYNQTCHAVWHAGPRCKEGYAHDVVWDV